MADKKDFWVTPRDDGRWNVRREGGSRASSVHSTQAEAWNEARERARSERGEAYLQSRTGQIRERNTYGHDPEKSKG
ncbi:MULTISPECIES: DUF2188 domain-containing protein [unclassified Sagittula]|uniref:DUF2188 domain-containing protein n=1 Tax=unclassified Sagittula TaxID=2624628 RepID=UPI0024C22820|nr:DUF2188 domain-containing protein [Sagittula sp. MA-2]WHZ37262.1 DUF2188 domain-containing protein [Sagittula sp. MA-2]